MSVVAASGRDAHAVYASRYGAQAWWATSGDILCLTPNVNPAIPAGSSPSTVLAVDPATGARSSYRVPGTAAAVVGSPPLALTAVGTSWRRCETGAVERVPLGGGPAVTLQRRVLGVPTDVTIAPDGGALAYGLYPCSASIAADGVPFHLVSVPSGSDHLIGPALGYPSWQSWAPDAPRLAITLGVFRTAWASDTRVAVCDASNGTCRSVSAPGGANSFAPMLGTGGRLGYVASTALGGPSGFGSGMPNTTTADRRWQLTPRVWLRGRSGPARELTTIGAADDPQWVPGTIGLLVVRSQSLGYLPDPAAPPLRITGPLPIGRASGYPFGYCGYIDWTMDVALAP